MTGITTIFDDYYVKHFDLLKGKSNYFFKKYGKEEVQDQLTDACIKIKTRITSTGFIPNSSGNILSGFTAYFYTTLWNAFRHRKNVEKKNRKNNLHHEDFNEVCLQDQINEALAEEEELNTDDNNYRIQTALLANEVLTFVYDHFTPFEYGLFEIYYLSRLNSYDKISKTTGIPKVTISKIMKDIRTALGTKFGRWRINIDNNTITNRITGEVKNYKKL